MDNRVELGEVSKCRRKMLVCIGQFKEHRNLIKSFKQEDDVTLPLIKHEVLDINDKFDSLR